MAAEGHAWVAEEFGAPEDVLRYVPRTWDPPATGALLVDVAAAGVGLPDAFMVQGDYPLVTAPPVSPGQEVCGLVVAAPEGSRFAIGDRVIGPTHFYAGSGGFATHSYVTEAHASIAPRNLSDEAAAGFHIGFRTAHTALVVRSGLRPGQSVLVLGGSGSTGAATIALAKALDARVVAVASTDERRAFCLGLGADAVVDRHPEAIREAGATHTDGGFDIVVDPVGGPIARAALGVVGRYGRFAVVGFASGEWVRLDPADMARRNYSAVGVLAAGFDPRENEDHLGRLRDLAEGGRISTPLGSVREMADAPAVIASLTAGAPPGKLVLTNR